MPVPVAAAALWILGAAGVAVGRRLVVKYLWRGVAKKTSIWAGKIATMYVTWEIVDWFDDKQHMAWSWLKGEQWIDLSKPQIVRASDGTYLQLSPNPEDDETVLVHQIFPGEGNDHLPSTPEVSVEDIRAATPVPAFADTVMSEDAIRKSGWSTDW